MAGKTLKLPDGRTIWLDTVTLLQIPKIGRLLSQDQYEKELKGMNGRFCTQQTVDDNISKKQVTIYYIKHRHHE